MYNIIIKYVWGLIFMIKIAICDDDINICSRLEDILIEYSVKNYLKFDIHIFYTGEKFLNVLKNKEEYDIIFLDIEIGDCSGILVGKFIREVLKNEIVKIVYISYHTNYAMKLFKIRPVDFLIKPINKEEFIKNMDTLLSLINKQSEYFEFKICFDKKKVYLKDIFYFTTLKESKKIILKTKEEEYIFYGKLKDIYENLKKYRFMLPHNSYIVNYDYIKTFKSNKIELFNGEEIPLSRYKVKEIKELQLKFIEEI